MTEQEIIDETVAYYGEDTNRRAYRGTSCVYLSQEGNKCAVGRCMLKEVNDRLLDDNGSIGQLTGHKDEALDPMLEERYRGHDVQFWIDLQELHDNKANWNISEGKGLSLVGQDWVNKIKKSYNTPKT